MNEVGVAGTHGINELVVESTRATFNIPSSHLQWLYDFFEVDPCYPNFKEYMDVLHLIGQPRLSYFWWDGNGCPTFSGAPLQ